MERVPTDLRALVIECAAQLLVQTRRARSLAVARAQAEDCLDSGAPRRKWDEMLVAQGADLVAFQRKLKRDHTAPVVLEVKARRSGYVSKCDARIIGEVIRNLGGGRLTKESVVNHDVGLDHIAKPGEAVQTGATLARIHAVSRLAAAAASARLVEAFQISRANPPRKPLIVGTIA